MNLPTHIKYPNALLSLACASLPHEHRPFARVLSFQDLSLARPLQEHCGDATYIPNRERPAASAGISPEQRHRHTAGTSTRNVAAAGWGTWDFWQHRRLLFMKRVLARHASQAEDAVPAARQRSVARVNVGENIRHTPTPSPSRSSGSSAHSSDPRLGSRRWGRCLS